MAKSRIERSRQAIERFSEASKSDPRVIAAFLGGSYAAGPPDDQSDIDVYLVVREREYEAFWAGRQGFLRSWGGIAWSRDVRNFEGLGWDMIQFIMDDGVDGELALSHEGNFRGTHGGPHVVLVDKVGLLQGVEFPKLDFGPPSKEEVQESLLDFWLEARAATKAWYRGKLWEAAEWVAAMRKRCRSHARLLQAEDREERLAPSFTALDRADVARAIRSVLAAYQDWGPRAAGKAGAEYPAVLARLATRRIEDALESAAGSKQSRSGGSRGHSHTPRRHGLIARQTSRAPSGKGDGQVAQKPGSIVHVEFHSNAPEKTKSFLQDVFGWKFEDVPAMNYSMFQPPSPPGGGLQAVQNLPAGIINYILSTDIENALGKITSSGGSVLMPKTEIPGMGHFAVFQDPTGITLALYEAGPPARQARPAKRKAAKRAARSAKKSSRQSR